MIFYILKLWKQPSILNKEYFFIQELILFVKKKNIRTSFSVLSSVPFCIFVLNSTLILSYFLFI